MERQPQFPDPVKVKQTIANSRRSRQAMELAGLQLEEAILKLEAHNRLARKARLNKVLGQLEG